MANVVFYVRTKFIKIEEKKKVVNIVKNRKFKYRNFFLYGNFKNYCKENFISRKFFPNGHSRKFISRNFSKMAIRESLSREIARIQVETARKFISRKFLRLK